MVFKYASDLFAVMDLSETDQADFFTNAASKGGLEMVVPSLYYDFMQAQQKVFVMWKENDRSTRNQMQLKRRNQNSAPQLHSEPYPDQDRSSSSPSPGRQSPWQSTLIRQIGET
ncbi:Hypothetical_protein [Hexamita inflata]|uniref:Hypothetical_protein n=1 Tax=Hexamita inflata TaxID=28002 RepID=A0ABP1HY91_9EUKA